MTDSFPRDDGFGTDPFTIEAGAYVLGALEPAERSAFEAHVRTCAVCRDAVEDVAVLPALLDVVPPELVSALERDAGLPVGAGRPSAPTRDEGPPPDVLADLLRAVRVDAARHRRRRGVVAAFSVAAVMVAAVVLSSGVLPLPWREPAPSPTIAAEALEMTAVTPGPVTASVRLDGVPWGTRVELTCAYADAAGDTGYQYDTPVAPTYSLVVRSASGVVEEVATWSAVPGTEVTVPGATVLPREDIVEVELRGPDGAPLLRASA